MSLTSELRDAGSPTRAYLDGVSPVLAATRGSSGTAQQMAGALGLVDLVAKPLVVPADNAVDGRLSGTAFDIRARIELGGFDPTVSTSAAGVEALPGVAALVENGEHRAAVLSEAFRIGEELLREPDPSDPTRASILFAYCEQVYRGGADALSGALGAACDGVEDGLGLARAIPESVVDDVKALLEASRAQIGAWNGLIAAGARLEPNPSFSGARLLGGADGDWMIGETLIDCKVYSELSVVKLRDFLRQLLGYVLLDLEDALGIREVGVWLPRQRALRTWTLKHLLGGDPETLLPKLREGFIGATARNQIAVHVPVSERRKLQLLADNRHTPHAMLIALSQGDDIDLRFRVGRNASSPKEVVGQLSMDHYARVREGVGMNPVSSVEILKSLSIDASVAVRRAVAANPAWSRATTQVQIASGVDDAGGPLISSDVPTGEVAVLDRSSSALSDAHAVAIRQDRDPGGTSGVSLGSILQTLLHGREDPAVDFCLPEASRRWAFWTGRSLRLPAAATRGLPIKIIADLMADERAAHVRQLAATALPVANTVVRERLFSDRDPGIRWAALERSVHAPDPFLRDVLVELGSSRLARVKFVTDGLEPFERWNTPAEYSAQVLELIAGHPSTPTETLASLVAEKLVEVQLALAGNPSLSPDSLADLSERMMRTRSLASRERFASSRRTPVVVLESLSTDRSVEVRAAVAGSPAAPEHVLSSLSHDPSAEVRLEVLANASTPDELARSVAESLLQESVDRELHSTLAAVEDRHDLALPAALVEDGLDRLSKSRIREPDVRWYVARDERASTRTLERLAKSKDESVRGAVANNPRTPLQILDALAHDHEPSVRRSVARNERLSQDTLNALLLDDDLDVRVTAYRNPAADTKDDGAHKSQSLDVALAAWTSIPTVEELREMAANSRAELRIRVAYSEHATPDILAFLAGERRSAKVRQAVAAHPKTPPEVLRSLATRDDADILLSVAFHPETPTELLADLAGRSIEFAVMVALNPDAPVEVLDALAEDSDAFVRFVAKTQRDERLRLVSPGDAMPSGSVEAHPRGQVEQQTEPKGKLGMP